MLAGGLVLASCAEKCQYDCGKKTSDCATFPLACQGGDALIKFTPCNVACGVSDAINGK